MKVSAAPQLSKGFWTALDDLDITETYIITPVDEMYQIKEHIWVTGIYGFLSKIIN